MIRPVCPTDAPAIAALYNKYVLETTITFETEPVSVDEMAKRIDEIASEHSYYIYEENGVLLGYCCTHRWKERAAYSRTLETTIYLSPQAWGKGVGRQLMDIIIHESREQGYHALIACITAENTASTAFHAKMGFHRVSHFEKVGCKFGRILDVDDWELVLI